MSNQSAHKQTKDCHNCFSSAEPKKAAACKENHACFYFVDKTKAGIVSLARPSQERLPSKTKAGTLGSSALFTC